MGIFEKKLSCGCIETTSTYNFPPVTDITSFCEIHNKKLATPFHHAIPVHDLDLAKKFYGEILGCKEGRSSKTWVDYSLYGNQLVCHYVGDSYKCIDYYNNVDKDEVPVPHFGVILTIDEFVKLAFHVKKAGIKFIVEPHLRFENTPSAQWTMFFKDPSNNNLEFKAMVNPENLFAKY